MFRVKGGLPYDWHVVYGFLALLIISLITSLVVHYAIRYRFLEGFDGFMGKWIAGWVAAWLGSPVLGHWFAGVEIAGIDILPALVGAFTGAFALPAIWKAKAGGLKPRGFDAHETQKAA
jgi:uncharacterized membrane protein YeaQ/YmgE (transglycosylase-associated protein family)